MPKLAQNLLALAVAVLVAGTSLTAITTVPPAQDGTATTPPARPLRNCQKHNVWLRHWTKILFLLKK